MRKTVVLNSDEMVTLAQLAGLNDRILTEGLTKDNAEDLQELQHELVEIISKFVKIKSIII